MTGGKKENRRQLGQRGEEIAADYLQANGYTVIQRNWRCPSGEIDIVAEQEDRLIFIEVRTRRATGTFGTAAESVIGSKQRQVRETAQVYLYRNKCHAQKIRFDVIAVQMNGDGCYHSLRHIQAAF